MGVIVVNLGLQAEKEIEKVLRLEISFARIVERLKIYMCGGTPEDLIGK